MLQAAAAEPLLTRHTTVDAVVRSSMDDLPQSSAAAETASTVTHAPIDHHQARRGRNVEAEDMALPRLVNLNQDPLFSETLVYALRVGVTTVGTAPDADIQLRCEMQFHYSVIY